jgi:hypothetical protein
MPGIDYALTYVQGDWGALANSDMEKKHKRDFQTISVFIILAFLTSVLVLGARLVLFAPNEPIHIPTVQEAGKLAP